MVDFGQALRDYVRFGYCTSLGNIATFGEIFGGGGSSIGEFGINAARFLHNQVCNTPPPAEPDPPFSGGQCAVQYDVTVQITRASGTIQNPFTVGTVRVNGPVGSAGFLSGAGNSTLVFVNASPVGGSPPGRYSVGSVATNFGGGENVNAAYIINIVRVDGQPDNCGDPPPVIPPYTPGSNSVTNNVNYTDEGGNNITIPVVVAFGYAKVDVNGTLNIPFTLNLDITPTANITGNFNLNTGDVTYNAGNPALPPANCGGNSDDFSPDPDNPPPNSPDNPDEPDPNPDPDKPQTRKLLVGCLVTVSQASGDCTTLFQGQNPDVFIPDTGLVSFKVSVGGFVGWTEDIRVKNARQFIPCPWRGGAIDVSGTPRNGTVMTVTPVYEKVTIGSSFPD